MAHSQIAGQQQKAAAGAAGSGRAPGIAAHSRGQEQDSRNAYRLSQEEEDLSLSFLGEKMDSAGPEESAYAGSMGADAVDPLMRRLQADMGSGFGSASYGTGNLHPYSTSPMPVTHPAFLLSRQSPRIAPPPVRSLPPRYLCRCLLVRILGRTRTRSSSVLCSQCPPAHTFGRTHARASQKC